MLDVTPLIEKSCSGTKRDLMIRFILPKIISSCRSVSQRAVFPHRILYLLLVLGMTSGAETLAQCEKVSNPGNNVLSEELVCAPRTFEWWVKWAINDATTVEFEIDWDDGVVETVSVPSATNNTYEAVVTHVYPTGGDKCVYSPKARVRVNGVLCNGEQTQEFVRVWDLDNENGGSLRTDPRVYRVCLGESATVQFTDQSNWNCTPPTETDKVNNFERWTQWIYGTGGGVNRIPNVTVSGASGYPFQDNVQYLEPGVDFDLLDPQPAPPKNQSRAVFVPATTDPADVGKRFELTLRNWNTCNPYDEDLTDGTLNPADLADGDEDPITTTAQIVIVEKSAPNFSTHRNAVSGPAATEFCIGDAVYFKNLTPIIDDDADGTNDADFGYQWEFFDDDTGSSLLSTSNSVNPNFSYPSAGRKLIRLTATDNNSVGNCGGVYEGYVDIISTADATIATTATDGSALPPLCHDNNTFTVRYTDVSPDFDPASSRWQWNFMDEAGTTFRSESGSGASSSFDISYSAPGTYATELVASAVGVSCVTRDTALVHVYDQPEADFTVTSLCQADSAEFISTATLPVVVNSDQIAQYAWDLDDDGIFEITSTNDDPFKHQFATSGNFTIRHRVTTAKGQCSATLTKTITVEPSPNPSFTADQTAGCAPLAVALRMNTPLAAQPVGSSAYVWHVKDLKTGAVTTTPVSPAEDSFSPPPFLNNQTGFADHLYEVWVTARATNGCEVNSDPLTLTVFAHPPADFMVTNLSGGDLNCSPRPYSFAVSAATQAYAPDTYRWTITDATDGSVVDERTVVGSQPTFGYTLTNDGLTARQFRVRLQPEKATLCFEPVEKVVTVNPTPASTFAVEQIDADCAWVTYRATAEQSGVFYQWAPSPPPSNNPDLTKESITLVYPKQLGGATSVQLSLETTNLANCASAATQETLTVDPRENIDASLVVQPSVLEIPDRTVTIINNTNPGPWDYTWDFGDGNTSDQAIPGSHAYADAGAYWIKLTVRGQHCTEVDSARVIVKQAPPAIDFTYTERTTCLPLVLEFSNTSQYADTATFLWNFGDGTLSTELHPSHQYEASGVYTISLQASNALGVTVKKEKQLIVDLERGPQAAFEVRLARQYLPDQDISFKNNSERAEFYRWDFGDGSVSSEAEPVHQYYNSGTYDVMLIASNALGCADTLVQPVVIQPLVPEVDFVFDPPRGCRPLTVQFRNRSRYADPTSYRWSFGAGEGVSADENPTYTYYEPGIYTVTLQASNSAGVTVEERKEFSVEVFETPRAYFNLRPERVFLSEPVYFVNLSVGADTYHWDFGDSTTSAEINPEHVYAQTGTYDVTLIARSQQGCVDTLLVEAAVTVEEGGEVMIPNAFTPNLSGQVNSEAGGANGNNDVFLPVLEGVTRFHMMIYNRWGELLFESFDKHYGWNGYYKGRLCNKDVYVYKLQLEFNDGATKTLAGDVTLVR